MPNVSTILADIKTLPNGDKEQLFNVLGEIIIFSFHAKNLTQDVRKQRFSEGKICPHCPSKAVVRNGLSKGKQRYICKSCKKTFSDFTHSPIANSKKPVGKWLEYAKCMIMGYSIRKSAEIVNINIATAFFWRHKILEAIKKYMGLGVVEGVVEADETFLRVSYKGNHKHSKTFIMPRKARKRGQKASKRGISKEQACVACAIDRNENIIMDLICLGRVSSKQLESFYDGHIENGSTFCTDSHKSYIHFTQSLGIDHQRVQSGRYKVGSYHIQHINSLHSKLKKWMKNFNGVSTKHLSNYLYWFKWLEYCDDENEYIESKNFLINSNSRYIKFKISDFRAKVPIPVV